MFSFQNGWMILSKKIVFLQATGSRYSFFTKSKVDNWLFLLEVAQACSKTTSRPISRWGTLTWSNFSSGKISWKSLIPSSFERSGLNLRTLSSNTSRFLVLSAMILRDCFFSAILLRRLSVSSTCESRCSWTFAESRIWVCRRRLYFGLSNSLKGRILSSNSSIRYFSWTKSWHTKRCS